MPPASTLEIARRYLACGLSVAPVKPVSKTIDLPKLCASSSLNRWGLADWQLFVRRQPSGSELRAWFEQGDSNLALVTGYSGLFAIDFDDKQLFSRWAEQNPERRSTATQETARGYHLLYRSTPRICNSKFIFDRVEAGDILGFPRWITVSPSAHPQGGRYAWLPGHAPWEIGIRRVTGLAELGVTPTRYYNLRTRLAFALPHLLRTPRQTLRVIAQPRLERLPIWHKLVARRGRRSTHR